MCHYTFQPTFIVDISDVFQIKLKAIKAYKSQFKDDKKKRSPKSPFYLENFLAQDRFYGSIIGVKYGEPFLLKNPIEIENPINLLFS
jgi:LmbE family N-acetylglucosaminyl deacetylase